MNRNRTVERNYKDTLFRMIFHHPKDILELYNAINGTDYQNPDALEIITLENAIYMNMKNDQAFIVDCRMNLYEHQASINPNMPLRDLFYVAKEYQGMVSQKSLYSSRLVKLPTPYFVVFYNGLIEQPERKEMKLSDYYGEMPSLGAICPVCGACTAICIHHATRRCCGTCCRRMYLRKHSR